MNLKKISFLFVVAMPLWTQAQSWVPVDSGINRFVSSLFTDTIDNYLYAGKMMAPQGTYTHARWNGLAWDTLEAGCGGIPVTSMVRYGNKLVAAGGCGIKEWNGTIWQNLGDSTAPVHGLYVYNNELYATGFFDSIGGIAASRIAKWNGISWNAIDTTRWYGSGATCCMYYNGDLYMGGGFVNYNGTINRIAKWDGAQWSQVGSGISGSLGGVECMEIFNGQLYIGGLFSMPSAPGNAVASWNGTQWNTVGGGMESWNARVYDLQIFNGELVACGVFSVAGGQNIENVAKWDGTNWCGMDFNTGNNGILTMAVYNQELYIGGGFITINGDTMNYVAKWNGGNFASPCGNTTGIATNSSGNEVNIFPNPVSDNITFNFPYTKDRTLIFYDCTGREMLREKITETSLQLAVDGFPSGIYFYSILCTSDLPVQGTFNVIH